MSIEPTGYWTFFCNPAIWDVQRFLSSNLTPQRVQQSLPLIFAQFGSPARTPKMRGKSPGWPKGRRRTPKQRFKVVKKQPASA